MTAIWFRRFWTTNSVRPRSRMPSPLSTSAPPRSIARATPVRVSAAKSLPVFDCTSTIVCRPATAIPLRLVAPGSPVWTKSPVRAMRRTAPPRSATAKTSAARELVK